jgi:two-component system sensor histidine kinase HydH
MVKKLSFNIPPDRFSPVNSAAPLITFYEMVQGQGQDFWEWLAAFFAKLPQGIILAGRDGRVVVFNETAASFLGYKPLEVVGRLFVWDLCNPPANGQSPRFREGLEQGNAFPDEDVELAARGEGEHQATLKARVCGLYGRDGELLGAFANLGSLAEHRAAARERRTMVRKVSIGKIVSALAHEINNPLQTLRTSLELGLDSRKTYQRRKGYLEVANAEISRISQIIMVLRRFYPSSDNEILSADVNYSIQAALAKLGKTLTQNNIRLSLDLAGDLPPVRLIAHQLQNIFVSLIQDLLDTALPGSSLEIQTRRGQFDSLSIILAYITPYPEGQPVPGNPDPFDALVYSNREVRLALGLSISREIIIEHGGSLEMTGEDSKTFVISLPLV